MLLQHQLSCGGEKTLISRHFKLKKMASVPLPTATTCFALINLFILFSKILTSSPKVKSFF